jgi:hypothetical protein
MHDQTGTSNPNPLGLKAYNIMICKHVRRVGYSCAAVFFSGY